MEMALIGLCIVAAANLAITAALYTKLCRKSEQQRVEEAVEAEMESERMNKGFDNIMGYTVGGKTGFEQ